MKQLDIGQIVGIIANLGVIAGIVFLAIEIQQNNDLLEAQAREASNNRQTELQTYIFTDPALAELMLKVKRGEELTEVEQFQADAYARRRIRGMEAAFMNFQAGVSDSVNVDIFRAAFEGGNIGQPLFVEYQSMKPLLDPGFVQFVDENITGREPQQ